MAARLFTGPCEIWLKTYAEPAVDFDCNSVSGYTKAFDIDDGLEDNASEEFGEVTVEGTLGAIELYQTRQGLRLSGMGSPAALADFAKMIGLTSSDVTNVSGDTPKRYEVDFGGMRAPNYFNAVIRQRSAGDPDLYVGVYLFKCSLRIGGGWKRGQSEHGKVPFEIIALAMASDSANFAGKMARHYQEYELTTPTLTAVSGGANNPSVGDIVYLQGTGFGASQGTSSVTFHSAVTATTIVSWTSNLIVCRVPATAVTGNVKVTVNGVDSNNVSLTIV